MLIMFFVAGYFALPSLVRRGSEGFLKDKLVRIVVPWAVGVVFLAPPTAYLAYYNHGVPLGFLQFWATDFWKAAFQQSVYWFLGVLFALFFLLVMAYDISERLRETPQEASMPTWQLFLGFGAAMSLGMFLINQRFPVDTWLTNAKILVFQPLRVPLYVGYFGLGVYASRQRWFSTGGYTPHQLPWALLWLLAGPLYVVNRLYVLPTDLAPAIVGQAAHAILFNAFCLSSLMAGSALFSRRVAGSGPFWRRLSASSYGIYYVHPLLLYPLATLFAPLALPLFVKAPLVIFVALGLSWLVSAFVLPRVPVLRRAFAM